MTENNDPVAGKVKSMTDEERQALAEKLDKETEAFVSGLKKRSPNDFSREEFEQDLINHPAFLKELPTEGELPPLVEALQALKYDPDENSPEELARNYKDDGNENFKYRKYRWAALSYSEGIKQKSSDSELNAQLFSNRAACHFHLGKYNQSLSDCISALEFKEDHLKAIIRASQCCIQLETYREAIMWCQKGLKVNPTEKTLLEIKTKAAQGKRNHRKRETLAKKMSIQNEALLAAIKNKNIKLVGDTQNDHEVVDILAPVHPAAAGNKVFLQLDGSLVWPVLLLYPEYEQSDFIQAFCETVRFCDQLEVMFGDQLNLPPWDVDKKYKPHSVEICFEDEDCNSLICVDSSKTLLEALTHKSFKVFGGTPTFIVVIKESAFQTAFRKNFKSCTFFQ